MAKQSTSSFRTSDVGKIQKLFLAFSGIIAASPAAILWTEQFEGLPATLFFSTISVLVVIGTHGSMFLRRASIQKMAKARILSRFSILITTGIAAYIVFFVSFSAWVFPIPETKQFFYRAPFTSPRLLQDVEDTGSKGIQEWLLDRQPDDIKAIESTQWHPRPQIVVGLLISYLPAIIATSASIMLFSIYEIRYRK